MPKVSTNSSFFSSSVSMLVLEKLTIPSFASSVFLGMIKLLSYSSEIVTTPNFSTNSKGALFSMVFRLL